MDTLNVWQDVLKIAAEIEESKDKQEGEMTTMEFIAFLKDEHEVEMPIHRAYKHLENLVRKGELSKRKVRGINYYSPVSDI